MRVEHASLGISPSQSSQGLLFVTPHGPVTGFLAARAAEAHSLSPKVAPGTQPLFCLTVSLLP